MAIRQILKEGDETLNKVSRKVEKIDERVLQLLDDMKETMYKLYVQQASNTKLKGVYLFPAYQE